MPRVRKLLDSLKRREHFQQELIAQTDRFRVLVFDGPIQLLLGDIEKTNLHLSAVFREDFFERYGFECA